MSSARFARPLMAATFIGGVAAVAAFAALLSTPPVARSQTLVPSRAEAVSCNAAFCSWDEFAPTTSAFAEAFGPAGLFSLGSFTDCVGCLPGAGAFFDPRGFAFGLSKPHGNANAAGHTAPGTANALGGNSGSTASVGGASSNGEGAGPQFVASAATAAATLTANDGEVPVTANPEPGTVVLLASALFVLVPVVRRHRRG